MARFFTISTPITKNANARSGTAPIRLTMRPPKSLSRLRADPRPGWPATHELGEPPQYPWDTDSGDPGADEYYDYNQQDLHARSDQP